jgi:flagellar biosynthesis protein FliR
VTWDVPAASLVAIMLASLRAAAWLVVCPPFSSRLVPAPVKALISVAIALPVAPALADRAPALEAGPIAVSAVQQVVAGVALGFLTAVFFAAVQAAGDLIDLFGGFSGAFTLDPMSASQSSVFGRFYNLLAVTLLFATDGHQLILRGFLHSYRTLPLDGTVSLARLADLLTHGVATMFVAALQIAGPLIAVLFLADVALGLLNRVAPALNVLMLSFPAKIFLTLALGTVAVLVLPRALTNLIGLAVKAVVSLAGG